MERYQMEQSMGGDHGGGRIPPPNNLPREAPADSSPHSNILIQLGLAQVPAKYIICVMRTESVFDTAI